MLKSHNTEQSMISLKGRHTPKLIILQCVRWYGAYALIYRNIEEMMAERGLITDGELTKPI